MFLLLRMSSIALIMIIPVIFLILIFSLIGIYSWREVWEFESKRFNIPLGVTLERLESALKEEGIDFTRSKPGTRRSPYSPMFKALMKLETMDLQLKFLGPNGFSVVFLGPVTEHNDYNVQRLKSIIAKALV